MTAEGTSITPNNVHTQQGFLASAGAQFAALFGLSPSLVYATNITDRATGTFVAEKAVRRAAAAGSLGVTITFVIRLGKTPTEAFAGNITSTLSALTPKSPIFGALASSFASAVSLPASAFKFSVDPATVVLANAGFTFNGPAGAASASSGSGGSGGGIGAGVGVGVGALFVIVLAFWSYRSYRKSGKLPCMRDRANELFRAQEKATAEAMARLAKEAEAKQKEEARSGSLNPVVVVRGAKGAEEVRVPKAVADELEELRALKAAMAARGVDLSSLRSGARVEFSPQNV